MATRKRKLTSEDIIFGMRPVGGMFPDGSFDIIIGGSRVRVGPDSDFADDDARGTAEWMMAMNMRRMNPARKTKFGARRST